MKKPNLHTSFTTKGFSLQSSLGSEKKVTENHRLIQKRDNTIIIIIIIIIIITTIITLDNLLKA